MGKHAWRRLEGKRNPHIPHYSCYRCLSQASGTMVALNWDEPPPGVAGEGQGREGGDIRWPDGILTGFISLTQNGVLGTVDMGRLQGIA